MIFTLIYLFYQRSGGYGECHRTIYCANSQNAGRSLSGGKYSKKKKKLEEEEAVSCLKTLIKLKKDRFMA